jgi:hypothetical protein
VARAEIALRSCRTSTITITAITTTAITTLIQITITTVAGNS